MRVNGCPLLAVADSCATISIISEDICRNFQLSPDPTQTISIRQFDGRTTSIGRLLITLSIGPSTHSVYVHVVRNFSFNLLIGLDVGSLFDFYVSFRQKKVLQLEDLYQSSSLSQPTIATSTASSVATTVSTVTPSVATRAPSAGTKAPSGIRAPSAGTTALPTFAAAASTGTTAHSGTRAPSTAPSTGPTAPSSTTVASATPTVETIAPSVDPSVGTTAPSGTRPPSAGTSVAPTAPTGATEAPSAATTAYRRAPSASSRASSGTSAPSTVVTAYQSSTTSSSKTASLQTLLTKYDSVFAQHDTDIGRISIARHHIRLQPDTSPIYLRPYRHSQSDTEEIRRQIVALKKKGLVRDSISPWSSPVTLAQKKNGDRRLCIDYRRLNQVTIDERHPLPIIQDVFDRMSSARYFSTLDIAWAYWHIALDEESIEKTAFSTLDGHYEWLVLPFGMKNSPATFQRIIRLIVQDLLPKGVDAYLDDIIIYTRTEEEHLQLLEEVLSRLLQHNAKLRREKCIFFTKQIQYHGHIISGGTLQPAPEKLQAVAEFPVPTTLKQLERFLGLTSYYRRYIHRFSFIAEPLHRLKKKGVDFVWGTDQQMAFDTLKKKLTEPPVVAIFDDNKATFLHTDASEIGIGSILMQKNDQNQKEVIAYYSRRLTEAESKYDNCERECLAVVESVDHFRIYLHGRKFDIFSDNSALQWLFSIKKPI